MVPAGRYIDEHEADKERSVSDRTDKNKHVYLVINQSFSFYSISFSRWH